MNSCDGRSAAIRAGCFALGLLTALSSATSHAASPPPISEFVRTPEFSRPAISPDGRQIAVLALGAGGRRQLVVANAAEPAKGRVAAAFTDADIESFQWISDRRLVFQVNDLTVGGGDQLAPGLYAVDADGSAFRQLVDRDWRGQVASARRPGDRTLPWYTFLVDASHDLDSDDVFVMQVPWDPTRHRPGDEPPASVLLRLNTRTGESVNLSLGAPHGPGTWLVDEAGLARVRVVTTGGQVTVHYLDRAEGRWRVIAEFPASTGKGMVPLRVRRDGSVLVSANLDRDTRALYVYDPAAKRLLGEPLVAVEGFDFDGTPLWEVGADRLLGAHINADGAGTVWLDQRMKDIQKVLDTAMPTTVNRISVPIRPATPLMLVESFSDTQPTIYSTYNAETRTLTRIARAHPGIDPKSFGPSDFARIKTRDGTEMPLYYTRPPGTYGKSDFPAVVLIHGGPWLRGKRWGWDDEAQLLASRGYLVLEPEFRGSTGYGFRHFQAGWKQWGLAMQDDVADAVKWAIEKGLIDPNRVCVAGASYGGYATLMALARNPELFRCGAAWVGVTDIELLFTANWTDVSDSARRYGYRVLIGDPDKDAAQLRANSPLANAARITQPLLLAYGGSDLRVPLEHGRRFRDAVSRNNSRVEWIVYGDEGHGWNKIETRVDFWTRVEAFLAAELARPKSP